MDFYDIFDQVPASDLWWTWCTMKVLHWENLSHFKNPFVSLSHALIELEDNKISHLYSPYICHNLWLGACCRPRNTRKLNIDVSTPELSLGRILFCYWSPVWKLSIHMLYVDNFIIVTMFYCNYLANHTSFLLK